MKGPKLTDGLSAPRHVQLPPELITLMPYMTKAEFRVIIAVLSHGGDTPLPFSELQRLTHLSRPSVAAGVKDALERGILERTPVATDRGQPSFAYSVRYSSAQTPSLFQGVLDEKGANATGKVFLPPAPLKLSIVLIKDLDLKQQYLTIAKRCKKSRHLFGDNPRPVEVSRGALDKALKAAGVYYASRRQILDAAFQDAEYAERVAWALLAVYPLAQELGIADGAGWLVEAISGDWNLEEMAEDYLERVRARAEQRNARESLPEDILQGLEKIGYTSGFTEVARAFQEDPRRVRGWLLWAEDEMERDPDHAAARFRQAIRSGQQPPESATLIADLFDGV